MKRDILQPQNSFVISFRDGMVVCPKFSFGDDGYVNNYLNLDFYKYQIEDGKILFFDPMGRNTAFINTTDADFWQGYWYMQKVSIVLKQYTGVDVCKKSGQLKEFLSNTRWRFRTSNGSIISSNLWLSKDGLIRGYSHENEYAWRVENEELMFLNKEEEITSKFGGLITKGMGKTFYGYLASDINHVHSLEYLSGESAEFLSELHCVSVIGRANKSLFVFFNGAGTPYDGMNTRWEFYHLPYRLGVDFVRFSESSPVVWYLDKTQQIIGVLQGLVLNYENVVLVGASAGGFASMYFAERLAKDNPQVNFYSQVINPQTTLDVNDRRFVVESWEQPLRPVLPPDFIFNNRDTDVVKISQFLERNLNNVKHNVYYDSQNPCENFYAEQINHPRVLLCGIPINGGHADSGIKIFESQVLQNALVDFTNGPLNESI